MSTYTITDAVSQVLLGGQRDSVSLVNNGPSTIYLDDTTAVSTLNGLPLPPTGQMTWNSSAPLWAVCGSGGSATLSVNDSAGRVDAARAKFWSRLSLRTNPALSSANISTIECGHCETLLLKITINGGQAATPPTVLTITIFWKDFDGNVIDTDSIAVADLVADSAANPAIIFVRIPVVGSTFTYSIGHSKGLTVPTLRKVEVFGTDRVYPYRWYCATKDGAPGNTRVLSWRPTDVESDLGGDYVNYRAVPNARFGDQMFIANLGRVLVIEWSFSAVTTAGRMDIIDTFESTIIGHIDIPIAAGTTTYHQETSVPQKGVMSISSAAGLVASSFNVSITWREAN